MDYISSILAIVGILFAWILVSKTLDLLGIDLLAVFRSR